VTPARGSSLYDITAEVLVLHQRYEFAVEEGDSAQMAAIEAELKRYLHEALPAKVDGIRAYIRSEENAVDVHKAEAAYHAAKAKQAAANVERVKAMCLEVMQHFGQKLYKGALHTIRRCGNGGVKPLVIRQPELLANYMMAVTVTVRLDAWLDIMAMAAAAAPNTTTLLELQEITRCAKPHPDAIRIRSALERGEGVPGCELVERGEHVRLS
jgi:Siphovirus Gp157